MTRRKSINRVTAGFAAAVVLATGAKTVQAMPINLDDGWEANWDTTLSVGSTWRVAKPDSRLYTAADGNSVGQTGGSAGYPADDGDLNYRKGDRTSTVATLLSDIEVKHDDLGGLLRVKAWYDQALGREAVPYGSEANGYGRETQLSQEGFGSFERSSNVQLLDAYVYDTVHVASHPVQVRLGNQVINWGESLFFQGVNQINPINLSALRNPGSEVKDALLPVWAVDSSVGLGGGMSVEGFYQLKFDATQADGCGTYWSVTDIGVGTNPGACNKVPITTNASNAIATGYYIPVTQGMDGKDSGQFGLAVKVPVDVIDTEFGLYGMNITSRVPMWSTRTGTWGATPGATLAALVAAGQYTLSPIMATQNLLSAFGVQSGSTYWEYPGNMRVFGASAATNLSGWSLAAEASFVPDLPVQRNANDLVTGMLTGKGVLGSTYSNASSLTDIAGFDRKQKSQFQVNGLKTFAGIAGAAKTLFAGEAMVQYVNVPDYKDGTSVRYGRSPVFGTGSSSTLNTCAAGATNNPSGDGCANEGYVTPFSWGYRMRGELEYPQVFDTAVTYKPSLSFAHDVQGVSADGQLNGGRMQVGLGNRFVYDEKYTLDIEYVYYAPWATYDPLRDHDFVSATLSMTF